MQRRVRRRRGGETSIGSVRRTLVAVAATLLVLAPVPAAAKGPSVQAELARLLTEAQIDQPTHDRHRATWDAARETLRDLRGTRRAQLSGALRNVEEVAARGLLTPSRLPSLFLTVERNRAWWAGARLLRNGERVQFAGSQLVWQHYSGEGLQIQWLGTFGRANALWSFGGKDDELRQLLDEALALAAQRAGGIAFEYLFTFDGGKPPWASGLAQGTALQALSRAAVRLKDSRYFEAARSALGIFRTPPPEGVRVDEPEGAHFLIYSFWPQLRVLNGYVQGLNGLYDFAKLANDQEGRDLFSAGEARLRAELAGYDTGAWSMYSNRRESDLGYHKLVRDFLRGLCTRLQEGRLPLDPAPYCDTAQRFTGYLTTKPEISLRSTRARKGKPGLLRFTVSKISVVRVTVLRRGRVVFSRSARVGGGKRSFAFKPSRKGRVEVRLLATDLAGNSGASTGSLLVR